jgi:colanic acid biosynthesis protein WcaH
MFLPEETFLNIVQNAPLVSIDLIVRNPEGEILLGWRKNEPAKNTFFVPGGRILKNETISSAFGRITESELGYCEDISNSHFVGVFEHIYATNFSEQQGVGTHYVVLAYELPLRMSSSSLPPTQHDRYEWMSPEALLQKPEVHPLVKNYFAPGGLIYIRNAEANDTQYGIVAARRSSFDQMLWQTPVVSLTAQAFLFTIALSSEVAGSSRFIAAILAFITAAASIQLLIKHRFHEVKDACWLENFEKKNAYRGYKPVHSEQKTIPGNRVYVWLCKRKSFRVWLASLSAFAICALVICIWPQIVTTTKTPPVPYSGTFSNPPTQAELQAFAKYVESLRASRE